MASPGSWDAFSDLLTALKGIRGPGSGYWTDLGGRVFTRDLDPGSGTEMPFGVLVMSSEDVEESDEDERYAWSVQTIAAAFWIPDDSSDPGESAAMEIALKLRDDVRKAVHVVFRGADVNGVKDADVVRAVVGAGAGGGQPFGTLEVTIRWRQMQDLATLGP